MSSASGKKRSRQRPDNSYEGNLTLFRRQLGRQVRIDRAADEHVEHVKAGEHQAWEEGAGMELRHGHAGSRVEEDQHHARRDENAEASAGADQPGREAHVIAGAEHGREGEGAHEGDDRADDARRGGEHGAGYQRCKGEPGSPPTGDLDRVEQAIEDIRSLDDVAHSEVA